MPQPVANPHLFFKSLPVQQAISWLPAEDELLALGIAHDRTDYHSISARLLPGRCEGGWARCCCL